MSLKAERVRVSCPEMRWQAFQFTPKGPKKIPVPSPAVLQELSEQQAATFTPDGRSRKVLEIRAQVLKGRLKPKSRRRRSAASRSISSLGATKK